jgi:hypothetical protein
MAAKKGKSSAKVPGLKSKKLTADQAGQVKGGGNFELAHKDLVSGGLRGVEFKGGLPNTKLSGDFHIK